MKICQKKEWWMNKKPNSAASQKCWCHGGSRGKNNLGEITLPRDIGGFTALLKDTSGGYMFANNNVLKHVCSDPLKDCLINSALHFPLATFGWVSNDDSILCLFYFPAIKDYETAAQHSENDRQIKEGLERAQRLLKQSQKRDYYKILGVKRWEMISEL